MTRTPGRWATRAVLVAAAALVVPALWAPPAAAQLDPQPPVEVALVQFPDRLTPGRPVDFTLSVEYDCSRVHPQDGSQVRTNLIDGPEWLVAFSLAPGAVVQADTLTCLQNNARAIETFNWTVVALSSAPAFAEGDATFNASVAFVDATEDAEATRSVQAGFFSSLRVGVDDREARTRPGGTGTYDVTVTNDGNGDVVVSFQVEAPSAVTATTPSPVTVPTAAGGGAPGANERTLPLEASAGLPEGVQTRVYDITLSFQGALADDPSVGGDSGSLALTLRVTRPPEPESTPGPGGALVAVAVVAAALVAAVRRGRHDRRNGPRRR